MGSVKEHMIRTRSLCSWNIQTRRSLNDWEIGEIGRLMDLLERYSLGDKELEDEMQWLLNEGFSVKSMYGGLMQVSRSFLPGKCVWHPHIPTKASFLLWELWWNRAPTIDNLIRRGMTPQLVLLM